jgi:hypothetical protein
MSVTAKALSKSGARGKEIDAVVREQIQMIDDRLQRAPRTWGRNVVACDLGTTFNLPGLDKKNAQRIVYSAILRSLDKRGFETKLLLETDQTVLYVAWMTDLDVEEVAAMNALIRAKRIQRDDLPGFLQKGATPAPRAATFRHRSEAPELRVTEAGQVMHPRDGVADAETPVRSNPAPASAAEAAILDGS